ncbi:MAG TPA: SGNH/GDSL hydrolase family protein [Polyangia bacterium]|nr:SGNH/GDSL hydrolase family protein [Polyangia bacterium]
MPTKISTEGLFRLLAVTSLLAACSSSSPVTDGSGGSGGGPSGSGGSTAFSPCPASGTCTIMPLGDSITDGTGFSGGYRVELFAKAIADQKNITFVGSLSNGPDAVSGVTFPKAHEGHFGWTISQVDDLIPDPALNPAPHIVLLHLGTNDINQNAGPAAPGRLGSLIDQIVTDLPDALVVVAKIIPEPAQAAAIDSYNAAIPALVQTRASAGKHVILVDQFTGFPSSELGDGVHPNQAGYARMAGVWYDAIKSSLP